MKNCYSDSMDNLTALDKQVLVERPGTRGHAGNFASVAFPDAPIGSIARVAITGIHDDHLIGDIL